MEKESSYKQIMENKEDTKVYIGIGIIILSPVIGSLLFQFYVNFVGSMIYTNSAVNMFWLSCIFVVAVLGIAMVLIGCNEKSIKHKNTISE